MRRVVQLGLCDLASLVARMRDGPRVPRTAPGRNRVVVVVHGPPPPVQQMGVLVAQKLPIRVSLPRFHFRVGLHIDLFEIP